jgi:peptide/nickel transport system substrate-binding protein
MSKKVWALVALFIMLGTVVLVACQPATPETVEVTRIVTETIVEEGQQVEVTVVVPEVVEVTAAPPEVPEQPKDLVICQAQEPDTMYLYGGSMLAARAVQHAIFTNYITNLSFDYQADGLAKIPNIEDGDAVVNVVEVNEGDMVLTAADEPKELAVGDLIINADGEEVEFDGTPVMMEQMVVNFTMLPTVWSDGTPVSASDSVYAFNVALDPDTPTVKRVAQRTASYEATGDLDLTWTGMPGYIDSTYFINFWLPFPEHLWGDIAPIDMLTAEEVSRLPVGDGPFKIVEWNSGDSIRLERNEFYYRADEGLPYLDSVTFKFIPDTNQLLAQLLSGQCDIGTQDALSTNEAPFLIEAEASGLLVPYFQTGTVYEHMDFNIHPFGDYANTRYNWFDDASVRQALTMCTDRQGMVDNIMFGRSEVIHTYIPSVHPLYPEGLTEWPYDVAAANELLDAAGYDQRDDEGFRLDPNGQRFAPRAGTTAGNVMREQIMQIFKENLAECGVDVQIYFVPSSEWFADGPEGELFGRRYDLGEFAWLTGVEPACNLYAGYNIPGPEGETNPVTGLTYDQGWGGQNQTGYYNPDFDAACRAAEQSLPGTETYEESHKEAQRIFSEDVPVIPLFLRLKVAAARPEVQNFFVDPTQNSELYNIYELDLQ